MPQFVVNKQAQTNGDHEVHDKTVLVRARFAGSSLPRRLVFTGSHNWTESAKC